VGVRVRGVKVYVVMECGDDAEVLAVYDNPEAAEQHAVALNALTTFGPDVNVHEFDVRSAFAREAL
jgi:hypothetical protein